MTIVNWLNLLDQVLNYLTFLVSLIESSKVGVGAQDKVFDTSDFESFDVIIACLYKVFVQHN